VFEVLFVWGEGVRGVEMWGAFAPAGANRGTAGACRRVGVGRVVA